MLDVSLCLYDSLLELPENCLSRDVSCPAVNGFEQNFTLTCRCLHNSKARLQYLKSTFTELTPSKLGSLSIVLVGHFFVDSVMNEASQSLAKELLLVDVGSSEHHLSLDFSDSDVHV